MFALFSRYLSRAQCSLIAHPPTEAAPLLAVNPRDHAVVARPTNVGMAVCLIRFDAALRAMPQAISLAVNIGLPRFNFTSLKAGLDMRDLGPVLDHNGAPARSATKRTTVAGSSAQRRHASAR